MRFVCTGDIHENTEVPSSRKDDFKLTKIKKVEEIKDIAKKYNATAILQPGDFLSIPSPKSEFITEVIKRWMNCDLSETMFNLLNIKNNNENQMNTILDSIKDCVPIIGVVGNHEIYGNNINTLNKTSIKFLSEIGFVKFATKDNPIFFETEDGLKIAITGTHYHNGMDKPENIDDYIVEEKLGDIHIHIVHGMLVEKSVGNLYRHTTVEDIAKKTKADLTISGHDHLGFELKEIDGKYFVNPGSPFRISASLKEIERKPKVLLIDITKEKGIVIKSIYLKSAEPGKNVLDRSKLEEMVQRKANLENIKSTVIKAEINKGIDISDIISSIADNKNIAKEVTEEIVKEIAEKMSEMDKSNANCENYYVQKMVLKNFQSHVDTELNFSEGLNVLIGESRQGKTSILRAFDFIIENRSKKNVRRFITNGKDRCEVSIYLSNGYTITRIVERKANGKNGYIVENNNTGKVEEFNTKGLPIIQELMGFNTLDIDKDLSVPLNFLRQGDSWFLIGDKYTAPQREKIIGGIYGTHFADAVIRKYEREERSINASIKNKKEDKLSLENEINKYDYLEELDKTKDIIIEKQNQVMKLQEEINSIREIVNEIQRLTKEITLMEKIIEDTNCIDDVSEKIRFVKTLVDEYEKIKFIQSKRTSIIKEGKSFKLIIDRTSNVKLLLEKYSSLKDLILDNNELLKEYDAYKKTSNNVTNLKNNIRRENYIIEKTELVDDLNNKFRNFVTLSNEYKDFKSKAENITNLGFKIENDKKELCKLDKIIERTNILESLENNISKVDSLNKEVNDIKNIYNNKIKIEKKLVIADEFIENKNKELNTNINKFKNELLKENKCPICKHDINEQVVDRIIKKLVE
ncbi:AAA family ATPase [Clostridium perfringens]|uniref:AAA family ATPase n=1 Tax=Clostridium perfringens TaxID=1502 RepID=UPI0039ED6ADA